MSAAPRPSQRSPRSVSANGSTVQSGSVAGTQSVEPALVGKEEAELLGVEPGAPVFLFERTSRVRDGDVAEFVRSIYRGDRYRIVADIFSPTQLGGTHSNETPQR